MSSIEVIVNAAGGSFVEGESDKAIAGALAGAGVDAKVTLVERGDELTEAARRSGAEVLGAAGGDGTISAVASVAYEKGVPLGVIPLGTLNHFSKDLGIPQTLDGAAATIARGRVAEIDIGQVNDQIFLNNSSIGLYPHMVWRREQQQQTLGRSKWRAALSAALQVLRRRPFFRVRLKVGGVERVHQTPFVFIGNNPYAMELYNIGTRDHLDSGVLSVYFIRRGGRWGVVRLVLHTLFGTLDKMEEFEQLNVDELSIDTRQRHVLVAYDGEVRLMETPLNYRILPRELKVIVPGENAS